MMALGLHASIGCRQIPTIQISPEIRARAQSAVEAKRKLGEPPVSLQDIPASQPEGLYHILVYDPDGLLPAAHREGKDATRIYKVSGFPFERSCKEVERLWFVCRIT
jgi:hypothetical protein